MGFEKFGIVNYVSMTNIGDFVAHLEQGRVMATRCKKCDKSYFPPRMDCADCLDSSMEWFEIKETGKLLTYTNVKYGPAGFEDKAPYTLGIGEFGNGIKVFALLSRELLESEITVGMKIKVVPVKLPGDRVSFEMQKA